MYLPLQQGVSVGILLACLLAGQSYAGEANFGQDAKEAQEAADLASSKGFSPTDLKNPKATVSALEKKKIVTLRIKQFESEREAASQKIEQDAEGQ